MDLLDKFYEIEKRLEGERVQAGAIIASAGTVGGTETSDPVTWWLEQVRAATTAEEVLSIVELFRPLSWSDEERAEMSRMYIAVIDHFRQFEGHFSGVQEPA